MAPCSCTLLRDAGKRLRLRIRLRISSGRSQLQTQPQPKPHFTLKLVFPANGIPGSAIPSTSSFIILLQSALKNEMVALPSSSVTTLGSQCMDVVFP